MASKREEAAIKLLKEYNYVTSSTICSFEKNTIGYNELNGMRKEVEEFLEEPSK